MYDACQPQTCSSHVLEAAMVIPSTLNIKVIASATSAFLCMVGALILYSFQDLGRLALVIGCTQMLSLSLPAAQNPQSTGASPPNSLLGDPIAMLYAFATAGVFITMLNTASLLFEDRQIATFAYVALDGHLWQLYLVHLSTSLWCAAASFSACPGLFWA